MIHHTKSLFVSLVFVFSVVFTIFGTKAHKQELANTEENSLNVEEGSTIDAKIWLADFGYSNPVQALVLNEDGLTNQIPLSGGSVRANAASPFDSNIAYYLTTDRRVWKTTDGGGSFGALMLAIIVSAAPCHNVPGNCTNNVPPLVVNRLALDYPPISRKMLCLIGVQEHAKNNFQTL